MRTRRRMMNTASLVLRSAGVGVLVALMSVGPWGIAWADGTSFGEGTGNFVRGAGEIVQTDADNWRITATDNSIIEFNRFNVATQETIRYLQPDESARVLNRVIGGNPSKILGRIEGNGHIFLVNPAGVFFGQGATIDANGFQAGAGNISNGDFTSGVNRFRMPTDAEVIDLDAANVDPDIKAGQVITEAGAQIQAEFVALIGRYVENNGAITPRDVGGFVFLAAGNDVLVGREGSEVLLRIENALDEAPAGDARVDTDGVVNHGDIDAGRGAAWLRAGDYVANEIWHTGTIAGTNINLQAGAGGDVDVDGGQIVATNDFAREATVVSLFGDDVTLEGGTIDARNALGGGGTVTVGDVSREGSTATISADSQVLAGRGFDEDGALAGIGGLGAAIIVQSDGLTTVAGKLEAIGGIVGEDASTIGLIGRRVEFDGQATALADNGFGDIAVRTAAAQIDDVEQTAQILVRGGSDRAEARLDVDADGDGELDLDTTVTVLTEAQLEAAEGATTFLRGNLFLVADDGITIEATQDGTLDVSGRDLLLSGNQDDAARVAGVAGEEDPLVDQLGDVVMDKGDTVLSDGGRFNIEGRIGERIFRGAESAVLGTIDTSTDRTNATTGDGERGGEFQVLARDITVGSITTRGADAEDRGVDVSTRGGTAGSVTAIASGREDGGPGGALAAAIALRGDIDARGGDGSSAGESGTVDLLAGLDAIGGDGILLEPSGESLAISGREIFLVGPITGPTVDLALTASAPSLNRLGDPLQIQHGTGGGGAAGDIDVRDLTITVEVTDSEALGLVELTGDVSARDMAVTGAGLLLSGAKAPDADAIEVRSVDVNTLRVDGLLDFDPVDGEFSELRLSVAGNGTAPGGDPALSLGDIESRELNRRDADGRLISGTGFAAIDVEVANGDAVVGDIDAQAARVDIDVANGALSIGDIDTRGLTGIDASSDGGDVTLDATAGISLNGSIVTLGDDTNNAGGRDGDIRIDAGLGQTIDVVIHGIEVPTLDGTRILHPNAVITGGQVEMHNDISVVADADFDPANPDATTFFVRGSKDVILRNDLDTPDDSSDDTGIRIDVAEGLMLDLDAGGGGSGELMADGLTAIADSIRLASGDGIAADEAPDQKLNLANATFGEPGRGVEQLTFEQDASISAADGVGFVASVTRAADFALSFISRVGSTAVDEAAIGVADTDLTLVGAAGVDVSLDGDALEVGRLTIRTGGAHTQDFDVVASTASGEGENAINIEASTGGTGDLVVTSRLSGDSIRLTAGDGAVARSGRDAQVLVTDTALLTGVDPATNPDAVEIVQDASFGGDAGTAYIASARFAEGDLGVSGTTYVLRSREGSIEVTADQLPLLTGTAGPGTALTLDGAEGVILPTGATVDVQSLALETDGELLVDYDVEAEAGITLHSGRAGAGDLTVRDATLTTNDLVLLAGNPESTSTGSAGIVLEGSTSFAADADGTFDRFEMAQDRALGRTANDAVVDLFSDRIADGALAGANVVLGSRASGIQISAADAASLDGSALRLDTLRTATATVDGDLEGVTALLAAGELAVNGNLDVASGAHAIGTDLGDDLVAGDATIVRSLLVTNTGDSRVAAENRLAVGGDLLKTKSGDFVVDGVEIAAASVIVADPDAVDTQTLTIGSTNTQRVTLSGAIRADAPVGSDVVVTAREIDIAEIRAGGSEGQGGNVTLRSEDVGTAVGDSLIRVGNIETGGGSPKTTADDPLPLPPLDAGNITIVATAGGDNARVELVGSRVDASGGESVPQPEMDEAGNEFTPDPVPGADGAIEIDAGSGQITLERAGATDVAVTGGTIDFRSDVKLRRDVDAEGALFVVSPQTGLDVTGQGQVTFGGDVEAADLFLASGQSGSGDLVFADGAIVTARNVQLAAGSGADTAAAVSLPDNLVFARPDAAVANQSSVSVIQDAALDPGVVSQLLALATYGVTDGQDLAGFRIGIQTNGGVLVVDRADLVDVDPAGGASMRIPDLALTLGGNEPDQADPAGGAVVTPDVRITGDQPLVLGRLVLIADDTVIDTGLTIDDLLQTSGNVTIGGAGLQGGDLDLPGRLEFNGGDGREQALVVNGGALNFGGDINNNEDAALTVRADDGIVLTSQGDQILNAGDGSLTLVGALRKAFGDLRLRGNELHVEGAAPAQVEGDLSPTENVAIHVENGDLIVGELAPLALANRVLTPDEITARTAYFVDGSIIASDDVVLTGPGEITSDSPVEIRSTGGFVHIATLEAKDAGGNATDVTIRTPLFAQIESNAVTDEAGEVVGIEPWDVGNLAFLTDVVNVASDTSVRALDVDFQGGVIGEGDLELRASAGDIRFGRNVNMAPSSDLVLAAADQIEFNFRDRAHLVRAGSIRLEREGELAGANAYLIERGTDRRGDPVGATDLNLVATRGDVEIEAGESVLASGNLGVSAVRFVKLSNTTARNLRVAGREIAVARDSLVMANRIDMSSTPTGNAVFATPTGAEISAELVSDDVFVRAISDAGVQLTEAQLRAGDLPVPTGRVRFDSARQSLVVAAAQDFSQLPRSLAFAADASFDARPLWGEELLGHVREAAYRESGSADGLPPVGAPGTFAGDDARLGGIRMDRLVAIYWDVFRPTRERDETTGLVDIEDRTAELRALFQAVLDDYRTRGGGTIVGGAELARFIERDTAQGEARVALARLGDLMRAARELSLEESEFERFRDGVLAELRPEGMTAEAFAAAVGD